MKTISKEIVNTHIMRTVALEYDQDKTSYSLHPIIDGYQFDIEFEINETVITCDNEFYGTRRGLEEQFKAIRRSNYSKTLQQLFDAWYELHEKQLYEFEQAEKAIQSTNYTLNEKYR